MRKPVLCLAVALLALFASEVRANTVLTTTKSDVTKQCNGKLSCVTACGSTRCVYGCSGSKCTVVIGIVKSGAGGPAGETSTSGAANAR